MVGIGSRGGMGRGIEGLSEKNVPKIDWSDTLYNLVIEMELGLNILS